MKNPISIIKASGEKSIFSEEKVRSSLRLSGADEKQIDFILAEIHKQLHEGMTTRSIYKIAFSLLKNFTNSFAGLFAYISVLSFDLMASYKSKTFSKNSNPVGVKSSLLSCSKIARILWVSKTEYCENSELFFSNPISFRPKQKSYFANIPAYCNSISEYSQCPA